ncbi:MAG TPA: type I DNA topoisomerase, partial [Bacillota bacterium]|nr:type I DNA topoisomerase [Bacillota bacterium]
MSYLVIVESPTKARTIRRMLDQRRYRVMASQGHLIDLPKSQLGIDIEKGFEPRYITIRGKGSILKELKEAGKKAQKVFLAADPDREGEAICWHLCQALNLDDSSPCRVEFFEITEAAVKEAFKNPHPINMNRVEAQQTRRILDRLVGYQISPLLWRNLRSGLSAGRVQSVAVRLICDREEEIRSFVPEEYWTLEAEFAAGEEESSRFRAELDRFRNKKIKLSSKEELDRVVEAVGGGPFTVDRVVKSRRKRQPLPPFNTSSLQQEASTKLGFPSSKTMSLAQQLYEGIKIGSETVGLITYMRTDSLRVSAQAQEQAREYLRSRFGEDFIPPAPPVYRSRQRTQEAHEAIRPTSVFRDPESVQPYLTRDQLRLYQLIWTRFMASQMAPALYDQVRVQIGAPGGYSFKATGSILLFPGFLLFYREEEKEGEAPLPPLEEGQVLKLLQLHPEQHFTQPPPRYTEASLIKVLEEKGIGRPSTYAPIIQTIQGRGYVKKEKKTFLPTELGQVVVDLLKKYFPEIIDISFTAQMELQLDQIAEGKQKRIQVLEQFYDNFSRRLAKAQEEIRRIELAAEESDEICPQCQRRLIYKHGRFGKFLA